MSQMFLAFHVLWEQTNHQNGAAMLEKATNINVVENLLNVFLFQQILNVYTKYWYMIKRTNQFNHILAVNNLNGLIQYFGAKIKKTSTWNHQVPPRFHSYE